MPDINEIYKMLNWKNPSAVQDEGIRLAQEIDDLSLLIQPQAEPSVWEQCAKILSQKSDIELEPYLDGLLEWLQDLNWPGALTIAERLKIYSGKRLKGSFENAVAKAQKMPKEEGLRWLDYLSELLDNKQLKVELPKEILEKLQDHYRNWGAWYDE